MLQKILLVVILELIFLILLAFIIFSTFHYLDKDDKAEKIFFMILAGFCFIMMVITGIVFMTC